MELTEINLVVADLDPSHAFYVALGCTFRSVGPADEVPGQAYLTEPGGTIPISLHTAEFAKWWDPTGPTPTAGSTTIDLTFDDPDAAERIVAAALAHGGAVIAPTRDMPWGQAYTIITDPDGYRWGLKSAPRAG